jgi:hypothetical protein
MLRKAMTTLRIALLVALIGALAAPAFGAITAEGTVSHGGANGTSVSFTHDSGLSGSNCILIVGVVERDESGIDDITGATFNGDALTKETYYAPPGGFVTAVSILYRVAPDRVSGTVQVNRSGSDAIVAGAQTFCGVDQSTPFGTAVTTSTSAASISSDVSSATGELVIDVFGQSGPSTATVGAGQTELVNAADAQSRLLGMSTEAGAATTTMSWTTDGGQVQVQVAIPLKPAAEAPTSTFLRRKPIIFQ